MRICMQTVQMYVSFIHVYTHAIVRRGALLFVGMYVHVHMFAFM